MKLTEAHKFQSEFEHLLAKFGYVLDQPVVPQVPQEMNANGDVVTNITSSFRPKI